MSDAPDRPKTIAYDRRRYARLQAAFLAVCEASPDQKWQRLDEVAGTDLRLRSELEQLLLSDEKSVPHLLRSRLAQSEAGSSGREFGDQLESAEALALGSRVGGFRIVRKIGAGGMGVIYLAEQDHPSREVALKVIHPVAVSQEAVLRFEHEAQMLARLNHPFIAQIYEAGTQQTGLGPQPYFAMELVSGAVLNDYIVAQRPDVSNRVALLADIADAVQHAHQKGIIHRDLKPANILIDASGRPKILDFGVARLTQPDSEAGSVTRVGQLVGTLRYMSPEQAAGRTAEVDARSDVYALGLVGFEMLAGRLPYPLDECDFARAIHTIMEQRPLALSAVDRRFRGDLTRILAMALEKDPERRYPAASDLASDLRRYLRHEPITARPSSAWYHARLFGRRHRGLVAGFALAVAMLLAGIGTTSWQWLRAQQAETQVRKERDQASAARNSAQAARDDALAEARRAQAVIDFLERMLTSANPLVARGRDIGLLRDLLSDAASKLDAGVPDEPRVAASLHEAIGKTYAGLGLYPDASRHLERALSLRDELGDAACGLKMHLGFVFSESCRFAESEAYLRTALSEQHERLGQQHPDVARTLTYLGWLKFKQGEYGESEQHLQEAARIQRLSDPFDPMLRSETLAAQLCVLMRSRRFPEMAGLLPEWLANERQRFSGDIAQTVGELQRDTFRLLTGVALGEETEELMTKGLAFLERVIGRNHPLYAQSLVYAATVNFGFLMHPAAESRLREALTIQRQRLCAEHPEIAHTLTTLGRVLSEQGKTEEAETCLLKALTMRRKLFGPNHAQVAESLHALGAFLHDQCRLQEAEPILRNAYAIRLQVLGPDSDLTNESLVLLALDLRCAHRAEEAEALLADELKRRRVLLKSRDEHSGRSAIAALSSMLSGSEAPSAAIPNSGANLPQPHYLSYLSTATELAHCLMQQERLDEAESLAREMVDYMEDIGAERITYSELLLADIQCRRGDPVGAERQIRRLIAERDGSDFKDSAFRSTAHADLAQTLRSQKRFAEAEPLLLQCAARLESQHGPAYIDTRAAYHYLSRLYAEWDQPQRAIEWRAKAGHCYPD